MIPTVAAVTRVCLSELPYIRAFSQSAIDRGISFFHFIICRSEEMNRIGRFISSFLHDHQFCIYVAFEASTPNQGLLQFDVASLSITDYAILLDADEYVYSPLFNHMGDYILATGTQSSYFFPWILAPSDFSLSQYESGYLGHTGKHLARTESIVAIDTLHSFRIRGFDSIALFGFDSTIKMFVVHYWNRGFRDALLKCLYYRNFTPCKQSSRHELLDAAQGARLPVRLRILAALCLLPRYICLPSGPYDQFDQGLEAELLDLNADILQCLEESYGAYQKQLEGHDCLNLYPCPGGIIQWSTLLP